MTLLVGRVTASAFPELDAEFVEAHAAPMRAIFDPMAGGSRRIVIFGTRALGHRILVSARAAGLDVCAAADNDEVRRQGELDGVRILPPREAVERFGESAVFVVAIYNPGAVVEQLREYGCRRIATFPEYFANFSEYFGGMTGLALPESLLSHAKEIREASELLSDAASRREYSAQIAWRCTFDDALLAQPLEHSDMYFDPTIYGLSGCETLVDCGAFDGDSIREFMKRTGGAFHHAYAIEPDQENRRSLEEYVAGLSSAVSGAVTVLPFAVSDQNGMIRFDAGLGMASSAKESGAIEVPCRRLDDVIGIAPTLIKMDIEGAEPFALRGAEALIRSARPVLAICAYHYCEHLWEIPELLRKLAPDSHIVLRRYAEQCWETVYYAVPPERCRRADLDD